MLFTSNTNSELIERGKISNELTHEIMALIAPGWLGWAMVLGSFQCRGVLLLLYIVGQEPAVLAAGAGWVGYICFIFFIYLPFLMSCLLGDG